jgi:hypothetical protein
MASFQAKLEKNKESHAYILGADAFNHGLLPANNPYAYSSKPYEDWVDGYDDALFLRKL